MRTSDRRKFLGYLLSSAAATPILLSACQSGSSDGGPSDSPPKAPAARAPEPSAPEQTENAAERPAAEATGEPQTVTLQVGDNIKYSTNRIEVKSGAPIEVTIEHTGKLAKEAMGHNFVLLAKGTDMNTFANAAMGAVDNGYIPPNMEKAVIAHTEIVGGGESDTITFPAPAPGEYVYLCTFPGHYMNMNGKMIVS